ncbi:unnamed protein product [Litomosoides sigmodontis]|uniref:Guanylate kinase-like domain-containing protein n=1 Tax=Litomosoides sigmodontis TaxID=42156 RepID=A0A3P6SG00_LITSI|nr:unnamed protein product [Litomosoides sigmodontis]
MSSKKALINEQAGGNSEDFDLDTLEESLNSISMIRKTTHTSMSDDADRKCSFLETITKTVQISCQPPPIPFTVRGGSTEGCLILVELVLHPDLLNILATDDIILSINGRKISGMLLQDVRRLLKGLFAMDETFYMEIANRNSLPSSITEILAGEDYPELQIVIRNNVYQKTVPYTTRQPRNGEINGVHYKFVDVPTFRHLCDSNQLLEHGYYQASLRNPVVRLQLLEYNIIMRGRILMPSVSDKSNILLFCGDFYAFAETSLIGGLCAIGLELPHSSENTREEENEEHSLQIVVSERF